LWKDRAMTETIKQRQVAKVVQWALSEVFRHEATEILQGSMVTVSNVYLTPDLLSARVYLSIFNTTHPDEIRTFIEMNTPQIRNAMGKRIKNQVRRIPELEFFKDDTLDEVFKLEALYKELKEKDQQNKHETEE
jgi:ribosome-binding factor A